VPSEILSFEKASRASRLGAVILDSLIFTIPLAPAYFVALSPLFHGQRFNSVSLGAAMLASGSLFYVGLLIDMALWVVTAVLVHRNAQTIGKKLVGIKVARTDGSRASLGRIFWLRNVVNGLVNIVPFVGMFYWLVDSLMIFGEARRCCHDYIADTIVIRA
jgi:uncharacterized RDD family membrane protein YckC